MNSETGTKDQTKKVNRTIAEIVTDILQHRDENPTHGTNCACLDKYAREIKVQLIEVMPWMFSYNPEISSEEWKARVDKKSSVAHVLGMISRSMYY